MNPPRSDVEKSFDALFADAGGWCDPGPISELLNKKSRTYESVIIGIIDSSGMNAGVRKTENDTYFVGLSRGLFSGKYFNRTDHMIDGWTQLLRQSRTYRQYSDNMEFWLVMRTMLPFFVEWHELGHIAYGHLPESNAGTATLVEAGVLSSNRSSMSQTLNHAIEAAADSHSALMLLPLLLTTSAMPMGTQFLALSAGLMGLFLNFWANSDTHPHPSVRLACLYRFIEEGVRLSHLPEECLTGVKLAVEASNRLINEDGFLLSLYLHHFRLREKVTGISRSQLEQQCRRIIGRLKEDGLAKRCVELW